ncbi:SNF2 family DNA-dependent ATPase domain-containing protein [Zymoseptoria tritici IPO323]|uniref:SNF2 family DNA-dependent ATPase domain-containing protein n=1 Tax=Zymoseptoria tritici (strain CBS 115943 / IPO323) TaxID=336722 RepID=F9X9I4_ZYMTI|nr:SNF2 family DNA-dependent ATPase domain-containing protein [Zymoseptoria tritici IPO323]EGP87933.1 SNF2 family DNA-dependent ATPase domain-containing protein [Zymoseptoria tritici IPO323]
MAPSSTNNDKRKRVDVDLTGNDDEQTSSRKAPRTAAPSSQISRSQRPFAAAGSSTTEREAWLANDIEDDIDEVIGSSQDDAAGSDRLQLYGDLSIKIVGCQYYRGNANPGEHILMRREPGNPYDTNAIRIDNVSGHQIGHIPRKTAEKLSKYIDNRWLRYSSLMADGVLVRLADRETGPDPTSDEGKTLVEKMKVDKLPIKAITDAEKAEKQPAGGGSGSASKGGQPTYANGHIPNGTQEQQMAEILEASARIDPRGVAVTQQMGMNEDDLKNMPLASQPKGIKTSMLPYQLQALRWLLDHETPVLPGPGTDESVQLWTRSNGGYTNLASNFTTSQAPPLASGGILADDMGLGKTLEMISLIVADAEKFGRGTTLVVAPLSVMSNWTTQIDAHVKQSSKMSCYTYHGTGRVDSMAAEDFANYDVVLTTYQTLASDFMPRGKGSKQPENKLREKGLYSMEWRRVILDEGHIVRNPQTKGAGAVNNLTSRSRWVLTGTPIVNSLRDLFSLLRFVGITGGLNQLDVFNAVLVRPLSNGGAKSEDASILLQAVMRAFTLRRRKDMAFIDLRLPKLEEFVHRLDFTEKEQTRYDAFRDEAKGLMMKYEQNAAAGAKTTATYNHVLEVLLRMRQCCNHWGLCKERVSRLLAQLEKQAVVDLNPENTKALRDILQVQIESAEECAICLETLHEPVITACGHSFGKDCIVRVIEGQHKCPMCRAELKDESCLVKPATETGDEKADDEVDLHQSSSKLEGIVKILQATKTDKTIVFSQWTSFLDIVSARLDKDGVKYCRLDGTMNVAKRDEAIEALNSDPKTTVMLASLAACSVGLNLTAASNVILSDTWWAPAIEDQAVDRVHRLGQKKETKVFRLVMEGSIEEETIRIQTDKRKLMALAFSEKSNKRAAPKTSRIADIQRLLA